MSAAADIEIRENGGKTEVVDLESPMDFSLKHPLEHRWTLWYFESDKNLSWEESQKKITSFDTVEDFWSLYNHIKPASELKTGADYSLFKEGIRPMWEDPANKHGGRWLITFDKKQRNTNLVDRCWLAVLLCMIGETFDNTDEICGAVVNARYRADKVGVWTAHRTNTDVVLDIGRKLKEKLPISDHAVLNYESHEDISMRNCKVLYSI
ncbi:eukaryotic translation initiation factor 4E1-like [Cylas formicarius]|uniref:eukaryotic translation initiation factor 4E1-like n=1 Tax=Cylas formicarius TaxID=197179 RepID=UPI002958C07B|nr:eukaryotic translation initiation factor 4E1-like [Cylas formicarius]